MKGYKTVVLEIGGLGEKRAMEAPRERVSRGGGCSAVPRAAGVSLN